VSKLGSGGSFQVQKIFKMEVIRESTCVGVRGLEGGGGLRSGAGRRSAFDGAKSGRGNPREGGWKEKKGQGRGASKLT